MTAVFKHELRSYFHSLTAYVFGAFLLAFIGIGAMLYNLQAAVSNFEYVLSFASLVFVVIVPAWASRSFCGTTTASASPSMSPPPRWGRWPPCWCSFWRWVPWCAI